MPLAFEGCADGWRGPCEAGVNGGCVFGIILPEEAEA
jgi:hypothetical protein